jgi:hypothetical protein
MKSSLWARAGALLRLLIVQGFSRLGVGLLFFLDFYIKKYRMMIFLDAIIK